MNDLLSKILLGVNELIRGQQQLEKKLTSTQSELKKEIQSLQEDTYKRLESLQTSMTEEIQFLRSELLEEIAILEGKVDNNEKQAALRHEEHIREMRLVKIDIEFLKEKTAKHESEIYQIKMLNQ